MKRIISIIITIVMLMTSVQAAEWISISQWSYQAVSEIVSSDLLPDCLKGVGDYKRIINRGEFCELVYSVLKKSGMVENEKSSGYYANCEDYPAVNKLDSIIGVFRVNSTRVFNPTASTKREWAADILYKVLWEMNVFDYYYVPTDPILPDLIIAPTLKDYNDIENNGGVGLIIEKGIMGEVDDGYFMPNAEMTIEQAVTAVYRMYKAIPRVIKSDNEMGGAVREIGSGVLEEITDTAYNIKKDGRLLISLETDVYQKVFATEYKEQLLLFAVNFNNKTDVFDTDTAQIIYTIPHIVTELDPIKGYAYTISGKYMPYYSGIWSMDNYEIYPTEYSRYELQAMLGGKKNEYRVPDGVVYYTNQSDGGSLYRLDVNGENEMCIAKGYNCSNITYIDGKIFFEDMNNDRALYRVNSDGSGLIQISDGFVSLAYIYPRVISPYQYDSNYAYGKEIYGFYTVDSYFDIEVSTSPYNGVYEDDSVLYYKHTKNAYSRKHQMYNDKTYDEFRDGKRLYRRTTCGQHMKLADFYVTDPISENNGNGKLYFMNAQKLFETGSSPVYVSDNGELKVVSGEYSAACFGFVYDTMKNKVDYTKIAFITQDEVLMGTYHLLDLKTGKITQTSLLENPNKSAPVSSKDKKQYLFDNGDNHAKVYELNYIKYAEYKGKEIELGNVDVTGTWNNYVYYTDSCQHMGIHEPNGLQITEVDLLKRLDCTTGETTIMVDDCVGTSYIKETGTIIYRTSLSELKMIEQDKTPITIYPCKGLYTYDEMMYLFRVPEFAGHNSSIYKLSKDGVISKLTDDDAKKCNIYSE